MGIAECILPTANIGAYFSMFLAINGRLRFLENFLDNSSYKTDLEVFGLFSFFFERLSMKLIPIVNLD